MRVETAASKVAASAWHPAGARLRKWRCRQDRAGLFSYYTRYIKYLAWNVREWDRARLTREGHVGRLIFYTRDTIKLECSRTTKKRPFSTIHKATWIFTIEPPSFLFITKIKICPKQSRSFHSQKLNKLSSTKLKNELDISLLAERRKLSRLALLHTLHCRSP